MRELLSKIPGFIPIAIIIAIQILRVIRKGAKESKKKTDPPAAKPLAKPPVRPSVRPSVRPQTAPPRPQARPVSATPAPVLRGHWETADDDKPKQPPVKPPAGKKPLSQNIASFVHKEPAMPAAGKKSAEIPLPVVTPTAAAVMPPAAIMPAASPASHGFSQHLDSLSPLKRAVIMAEILGSPKGLN